MLTVVLFYSIHLVFPVGNAPAVQDDEPGIIYLFKILDRELKYNFFTCNFDNWRLGLLMLSAPIKIFRWRVLPQYIVSTKQPSDSGISRWYSSSLMLFIQPVDEHFDLISWPHVDLSTIAGIDRNIIVSAPNP